MPQALDGCEVDRHAHPYLCGEAFPPCLRDDVERWLAHGLVRTVQHLAVYVVQEQPCRFRTTSAIRNLQTKRNKTETKKTGKTAFANVSAEVVVAPTWQRHCNARDARNTAHAGCIDVPQWTVAAKMAAGTTLLSVYSMEPTTLCTTP